jgi:hypothetical protein
MASNQSSFSKPPFDIEHTPTVDAVILPLRTLGKRKTMNQADSDRIHELCSLVAVEQDRNKFLALVEELNRILAASKELLPQNKPPDRTAD